MYDYETYKWTYKDKSGLKMIIFARKQETADEIIRTENTNNVVFFKPVKFFFKKKAMVKEPPYALEQEQLQKAQNKLNYRNNH